jgi:CheY-like chemotaxis protein
VDRITLTVFASWKYPWGLNMKHILVVDDEKNICELYRRELEDDGYSVTVAGSGKEALASVENNPPDLIVLDIQMPGMSGVEILERIMGRDKGIPIILNTSYSHYRDDYTTWGADAYVVKSSDTSELKAEIRRLLGE